MINATDDNSSNKNRGRQHKEVSDDNDTLEGIVKATYPRLTTKEQLLIVETLECYTCCPARYVEVVEGADSRYGGTIFSGRNEIEALLFHLHKKGIISLDLAFRSQPGHGSGCTCCCELCVFIVVPGY